MKPEDIRENKMQNGKRMNAATTLARGFVGHLFKYMLKQKYVTCSTYNKFLPKIEKRVGRGGVLGRYKKLDNVAPYTIICALIDISVENGEAAKIMNNLSEMCYQFLDAHWKSYENRPDYVKLLIDQVDLYIEAWNNPDKKLDILYGKKKTDSRRRTTETFLEKLNEILISADINKAGN